MSPRFMEMLFRVLAEAASIMDCSTAKDRASAQLKSPSASLYPMARSRKVT